MGVTLQAALALVEAALASVDVAGLSGSDCALLSEALAAHEKRCAGLRARAAARAAGCGAHRERGFADPVDWLARTGGCSRSEARAALEVGAVLQDHPAVASGVGHGRLSLAQAAEITSTAAASGVPGCADELVSVARQVGLGGLKERARQIRLRAADPDELHRRQRSERGATHWTDGQGMVRLSARLSPEEGVGLVNRLEAETDRRWREAHRHGGGDSREQCAADALAGLVAGGGKGGGGRTDVVVVCDLRALLRGHAHPDEPCHIVGGGPLPVWRVRQLAADAFVKAVTHDGTRIDTVVHYGRHIPAVLRTALELGAPPGLEGLVCVEGDCDRRYGLELDHVDPYANWGPTSFGNLEPRCGPHHRDKTEADRKAGLLTGRSPP